MSYSFIDSLQSNILRFKEKRRQDLQVWFEDIKDKLHHDLRNAALEASLRGERKATLQYYPDDDLRYNQKYTYQQLCEFLRVSFLSVDDFKQCFVYAWPTPDDVDTITIVIEF